MSLRRQTNGWNKQYLAKITHFNKWRVRERWRDALQLRSTKFLFLMTLCSIHSGMTFSFQFCFFLSQYFHGCPVWTWFLWCMFPENAPRKRGAFEIHFLNRIECQQNKHYKMKVKSKTHSLLLLLSLLNKNNTNSVLPMWFADADDAYLFISNFEHKSNSVHIHELCAHKSCSWHNYV